MDHKTEPARMRDFVAYRVNIVANAIFRSTTRYFLEELDLRTPEVWVMTAIGNFQSMSASEISENMSIDKAQVSRSMGSLIARDYVARVADPNDNRKKLLRLTETGQGVFQRIQEISQHRQDRLLSRFSPEEQTQLYEFLERLKGNADHLLENNNGEDG